MTAPGHTAPPVTHPSTTSTAVSAAAIAGASLPLGALTSWAQGVLPDAGASFANSPSGWTVLTVVLVVAPRPSLAWAAVLEVASELRGLTYDPLLWSVVGVVAGPFVGAAAAAMTGRRTVHADVGAGAHGRAEPGVRRAHHGVLNARRSP